MYTVVVCSRCKYVWIVKNRPKTSQCGKCRRTRQFKKLKKYHTTQDKEEAKIARAFFQSRVNNQGEMFNRALERGHLDENMDAFLSQSQYLEMQGLDAQEVQESVDNILTPYRQRSEIKIIRDAFFEIEDADLDDFLAYTSDRGVSEENALLKLEGLVLSGAIDYYGEVQLTDIEARIEETFDDTRDTKPALSEPEHQPSSTSNRGIILAAVDKHGDKSVQAILDYAEDQGMERESAAVNLEKLALSGQITPDVKTQEITDVRTELIGERDGSDAEQNGHENERKPSNTSHRGVLLAAVDEHGNESVEAMLDYATSRGIDREKAAISLEKLALSGQISPGVGTQELIHARLSLVEEAGSHNTEDESSDAEGSESKQSDQRTKKHLSQQEIMEQAFNDQERPTKEDIIDFAVDHGMSQKKAERRLEKLRHHGRVTEQSDRSLRLM